MKTPTEKTHLKRLLVIALVVFLAFPVLFMTGAAIYHQHDVASRPAQTVVPEFKGLDVQTAEKQARQANVKTEVLLKRWDIPGPIGVVVGQTVPPGEAVQLQTMIGLEISVEDPDKAFWEEKRNRLKLNQNARGPDKK